MFAVEAGAGMSVGSASLQADAIDFLGDSANYAISLSVAGMALRWRAGAAFLKGLTLFVAGIWVMANAGWMVMNSNHPPHPDAMGGIGLLALAVNLACALILWTHRKGDANRRSVWICSRNDAIGNVAVVLAALGVFGTRSAWPDIAVAAILAMLGISGGVQIMRQSRVELTDNKSDISRHINV